MLKNGVMLDQYFQVQVGAEDFLCVFGGEHCAVDNSTG